MVKKRIKGKWYTVVRKHDRKIGGTQYDVGKHLRRVPGSGSSSSKSTKKTKARVKMPEMEKAISTSILDLSASEITKIKKDLNSARNRFEFVHDEHSEGNKSDFLYDINEGAETDLAEEIMEAFNSLPGMRLEYLRNDRGEDFSYEYIINDKSGNAKVISNQEKKVIENLFDGFNIGFFDDEYDGKKYTIVGISAYFRS